MPQSRSTKSQQYVGYTLLYLKLFDISDIDILQNSTKIHSDKKAYYNLIFNQKDKVKTQNLKANEIKNKKQAHQRSKFETKCY